jgi:3-isopropylmalate/(R)-2-methylmalate dehydratase large subunit
MSGPEAGGRTLFDKLWDAHVIVTREDGESLIWVDRHFLQEGSHHAFRAMEARGETVAEPGLSFGMADHYVPTTGRPRIADPVRAGMVEGLSANCARHGISLIGMGHPDQGIVHVVGPELGLTLPGLVIVCGDSHTSTHGAFGCFALGIGASEVAHVLMRQTLWQKKPATMRLWVDGRLGAHVSAKDLALHILGVIGVAGARGHALEFAGPAVAALSMEGRMTLCNMAAEMGARCGMVAPDDMTFAWVRGREHAPRGPGLEAALADWRALASDGDAVFDRELRIDGAAVAPTVTWGISPEDVLPIDGVVPGVDGLEGPQAAHVAAALDYMGLEAGQALRDVAIDGVFIGSCTNARIEDLRAAAAVLRGRKSVVPGLVSPGSSRVKRMAEAEGLDRVFVEAGLVFGDAGCSMCVGMNGDVGRAGERFASTTNRNFRGRQGVGVRTHLMSPAMVAAAAVTGRLTDVRGLGDG